MIGFVLSHVHCLLSLVLSLSLSSSNSTHAIPILIQNAVYTTDQEDGTKAIQSPVVMMKRATRHTSRETSLLQATNTNTNTASTGKVMATVQMMVDAVVVVTIINTKTHSNVLH